MRWNKHITQQSLDYLCDSLKEKIYLKKLNLSLHYLTNIESINGLNKSLLGLSNLLSLSLSIGCCYKIKTNEKNKLFEILKNLKQLNNLYIDVGSCNLNDESINILADSLSKCESIQTLGVVLGYQCKIKSIKQFGSSISLMPSLQQLYYYLDRSSNLVYVPFSFYTKNNNKLQKLYIILYQCVSLSSQSLKSITFDLSCLSNLKELTISLKYCKNTNQEFYECLSQSLFFAGTGTAGNITGTVSLDPKELFYSFSFDGIASLNLLNSILKESLRLIPPAIDVFHREAEQEIRIGEFEIKKGDIVTTHYIYNQSNNQIFSNPDTFDPQRWMNGKEQENTYNFTPFSLRPRNCIDQHLAMIEGKCMLAYILLNYEILPNTNQQEIKQNNLVYGFQKDNLNLFKKIKL
ncbi:hypothetical protein ABPG74_013144 [Tetrahymena malaccensis]